MLEIRNIRKTYRSKKGVETRALDGVSLTRYLRVPERGLVFLLGKSGSGNRRCSTSAAASTARTKARSSSEGAAARTFLQRTLTATATPASASSFRNTTCSTNFRWRTTSRSRSSFKTKSANPQEIRRILRIVEMEDFAKRKPIPCRAGRNSASPSRGHWSRTRRSSSPTNRQAPWTARQGGKCSTLSKNFRAINWSSSSRTTANLPNSTPTASSSSKTERSSPT